MTYLLAFLVPFGLVALFMPLANYAARVSGGIAYPGKRKIHKKPVYQLGGLAIFLAFIITALIFTGMDYLGSLLVPAALIFALGFYDDTAGLSAYKKLIAQILIAVFAVFVGSEITAVSSPFGGSIPLADFAFFGVSLSKALAVLWILLVMNVVNLSDGLDGLASGVVGISGLILFALSLFMLGQPVLAVLFAALAGSALGFLPFNFHPAKVFMGDSGSLLLGFLLATLAIISGAKIAAAVLVLGFPMLDLFWSVLRRFSRDGFSGIFKPDKQHIHHLLLDAGLNQREVVLIFYLISLSFGTLALFGQTRAKLIGFFALTLIMVAVLGLVFFYIKRKKTVKGWKLWGR